MWPNQVIPIRFQPLLMVLFQPALTEEAYEKALNRMACVYQSGMPTFHKTQWFEPGKMHYIINGIFLSLPKKGQASNFLNQAS